MAGHNIKRNALVTKEEAMKNKWNKKILYLRRVFIVGALIGGFAIITNCLNNLLVQPNEWSRFILHHFYNREESIDNVWIGSSHVYCDVNPEIMDELSGKYNFNLATGAQSFSQSYLLLQEADEKYNIQHVYLEMYYYIHVKGNGNPYEVDQHFVVWDYVANSLKKHIAIIEQKSTEELFAVYIPFTRFNKYIFDTDYINKQHKLKESEKYQRYEGILNENALSHKNGFCEYLRAMKEESASWSKSFSIEADPLLEEAEQYLRKIIEYCKENDIELTLFSSPIYELQLISDDDYDNYVKQINEIAATYDLEYYDFNLCKEEYLPIQKLEYFRDAGHLNADGAELFSTVLYDVVTNDKKEYFYDSYNEKLEKTEAAVYGLIKDTTDEEGKIRYEIASNRDTELEYRIEFILTERAEECELIQEYDRNKKFEYTNEAEGCFLISARLTGETEPFIEMRIDK